MPIQTDYSIELSAFIAVAYLIWLVKELIKWDISFKV